MKNNRANVDRTRSQYETALTRAVKIKAEASGTAIAWSS